MAHNLMEREDGTYAWTGAEPGWHRLGNPVGHLQTVDQIFTTMPEMDMHVVKEPLGVVSTGERTTMCATVRTDLPAGHPDRILGYVKDTYEVVQYRDIFRMFDELIERDEAVYDSVGLLGHGEQMFLVAKLPREFYINQDRFEEYLTFTTSHDQSYAIKTYFATIRTVCQNTLTASLRAAKTIVYLRHTKNVHERMLNVPALLGLATKKSKELQEVFNYLVNRPITHDLFNQYLVDVFPHQGDAPSRPTIEHRENVAMLFEGHTNQTPGIQGTWYAATQAVTEYVDHHQTANARVGPNAALAESLFGRRAKVKENALALAVAYAKK
jgi:phage/plasmid-like protein (TIGR03299 family)